MRITLGIIGVEDTLEIIQSVVNEYSEFRCLPFEHHCEEDVVEVLNTYSSQVDMWLMSGYYPYSVAKKRVNVDKPMFFIPYTGTGLYKTLYHILYNQHIDLKDISFDGIARSELKQIFDELDVDFQLDHLCQDFQKIGTVAQYHETLYKQGKTMMAVTCAGQVRDKLQSLNVPVSRVTPTKSAIESVLNMALRTYEMLRFKERQIAVQMFEVDDLAELPQNTYSSDEIYHTQITHTERLLTYAKKIQGSLKPVGPGRFVIFTTSGALNEITQNFTIVPDIEEMQQLSKKRVTCGIGIGQSAYEAEIHAGQALLHARKFGEGNWMVVLENQTVHGPLGKPEKLTYSYNPGKFQMISKQTSLSVMTLGKIDGVLKKIGKVEVTASELAQYMQITPRSARRILMKLEKKGFAKESGEETPHLRGRPRKRYRITLL